MVLGVWRLVIVGIRKPAPDHRPSQRLVQQPLVLSILSILSIDVHNAKISIPGADPTSPHCISLRPGDSLMTASVVLKYANGAPPNGNHVTRCFQPRSAWSSGSPSYRSASAESLYHAGTPGPADTVRTGAPAPGAGCRCPQPARAGNGNLGTRLACDSGTSAQQRSGLQRSIARFHLQSDN